MAQINLDAVNVLVCPKCHHSAAFLRTLSLIKSLEHNSPFFFDCEVCNIPYRAFFRDGVIVAQQRFPNFALGPMWAYSRMIPV